MTDQILAIIFLFTLFFVIGWVWLGCKYINDKRDYKAKKKQKQENYLDKLNK